MYGVCRPRDLTGCGSGLSSTEPPGRNCPATRGVRARILPISAAPGGAIPGAANLRALRGRRSGMNTNNQHREPRTGTRLVVGLVAPEFLATRRRACGKPHLGCDLQHSGTGAQALLKAEAEAEAEAEVGADVATGRKEIQDPR